MVLGAKAKNNLLTLLEELKIAKPKTKQIFEILNKLPNKQKSTLIVLPEVNRNLILAARNLPKVEVIQAKDLNALDLLSSKYLLMPKASLKIVKETFLKS